MKRRFLAAPAVLLGVLFGPTLARAHYVWARFEPSGLRIILSEHPGDEAPGLGSKIAATTATVDGAVQELEKTADDLRAALANPARVAEADCDYGLIERNGAKFQLRYHATAQTEPIACCDETAAADSIPRLAWIGCSDGTGQLVAMRHGQPLSGVMVKVIPNDGQTIELTTDDRGQVSVPGLDRGTAAVLLRVVDPADATREVEVRHYATLTVSPAGAGAVANSDATTSPDAMLKRAHDARACWGPGFTGFRAAIRVTGIGEAAEGRLVVGPEGEVDLDLPEGEARDWARGQLRSLVMHRGLSGPTELEPGATFADSDTANPYGRLIRLADDTMGSVYRIDGDIIREVHRTHGKTKFINRVLDIMRNAEGKVLPLAYSVAYWNPETNELVRVESFHDRWVRVGSHDLPAEHTQVRVADGDSSVRQIVLSEHIMGPKPSASAASR